MSFTTPAFVAVLAVILSGLPAEHALAQANDQPPQQTGRQLADDDKNDD